jgi:acetate kinase
LAVVPLTVLAVNAGSSSLKTALFDEVEGAVRRVLTLNVPRIDVAQLVVSGDGSAEQRVAIPGRPLDAVLDALRRFGQARPAAVSHRFVHGGPTLSGPAPLDSSVLATLRALVPWAPLHQSSALAGVAVVAQRFPGIEQVGCFDTAFHATLPEAASRLPLPDWTWRAGIRRYGFHGLSFEHVVSSLGAARTGRAVLAHLGNGTSLAAVVDGRCVDTTMGFTPDGGVVMGSRSGDLDPGVLLHLLDDGMSAGDLRSAVEEHGGLRGLSGGTADMRTLLERRSRDSRAELAVEIYCRRIRMQIGAYAALLGGLDTVVFTGGIGEHAPEIRAEVCQGLRHLGIEIDAEANAASAGSIGSAWSIGSAACSVLVLGADEELVLARHGCDFLHRLS